MTLNTLRNLTGAMLLSTAVMSVHAADEGFFVGGGLGASYGPKSCDVIEGHSGTKCDDKDFAWKLLAGYQFNPTFGVEAFYTDLGKLKTSYSADNDSAEYNRKMKGYGLAATASWPIDKQTSLFGKAGFAHTTADVTAKGTEESGQYSEKFSNNDFMAGAGVKYDIDKNLSFRVEWEFFNDVGKSKDDQANSHIKLQDGVDMHLFSASLIYTF